MLYILFSQPMPLYMIATYVTSQNCVLLMANTDSLLVDKYAELAFIANGRMN